MRAWQGGAVNTVPVRRTGACVAEGGVRKHSACAQDGCVRGGKGGGGGPGWTSTVPVRMAGWVGIKTGCVMCVLTVEGEYSVHQTGV